MAPHRGNALVHPATGATAIFDASAKMDINHLDMVVANHDSWAFDFVTAGPGLIYPRGSGHSLMFAAGLWLGATVSGGTRVAVGEYAQEFVPGPMARGASLPDEAAFRTYRIDHSGSGHAEYLNDAVSQGAPLDSLGKPLVLGDVTLWSVFNDADREAHTTESGSTQPLGVEIQQSTFAYASGGATADVIFLKFRIANKGGETLTNAYISLWSDPDLGGFNDDLVACDTTRSLGYAYNATDADVQYGATPPAVGISLLQGPKVERMAGVYDTLGMTAFIKYIGGTDPTSSAESMNYMRGLHADGTPIHEFENPLDPATTYMVFGDPVAGTGWLDANPGDRRMMLSSGPFTMAPGDVQTVTAAILVGQGPDRLASITAMRSAHDAIAEAKTLWMDLPFGAAGSKALALGIASTNPGPGDTRLWLSLPREGQAKVVVWDSSGRLVRTLLEGYRPAGTSTVSWDGRDARGRFAPSGIYVARLESSEGMAATKVTLIR